MGLLLKTVFENQKLDRLDHVSKKFVNKSPYDIFDNIPEILCEWWSNSGKDMRTFLEEKELSNFISEKTFENILLGKHYFSEHFLILLSSKIVPKVTLERLYWLNRNFAKAHPEATELQTDKNQILDFLKKKHTQKTEQQNKQTKERQKKYYIENSERIKKKANEYYHNNSDEISKRRKELYRANLIENRNKILKRQRERRDEINRRRRELYHQNLPESRRKKRENSIKHRDKRNARKRELYRENPEESRAKSREYSRKSKHKKRFQTKTGKIIFSLLNGLIQSKLQK